MTKHTPTPWKITVQQDVLLYIEKTKGNKQATANAALIVRAVNCQEELIEMLEKVTNQQGHNIPVVQFNRIVDLIARAKGI